MSIILIVILTFLMNPRSTQNHRDFMSRATILKEKILTDSTIAALEKPPVESLGYVAFLSVSDGNTRAREYYGKGKSLSYAWDDAVKNAVNELDDNSAVPKWLRVDLVSKAWEIDSKTLKNEIGNSSSGFDFIGLSFDNSFETSLLEGELNGRSIYDYKNDEISLIHLNEWLEEKGKKPLDELPEHMIAFKCWSWFCDENNAVLPLCHEGADTGRREVSAIDAEYAKDIIDTPS